MSIASVYVSQRARDRRLKNMLEAAMRSGTEGQLVKAMNEYTMFVHADTGELDRAEDRLAYLGLKTSQYSRGFQSQGRL